MASSSEADQDLLFSALFTTRRNQEDRGQPEEALPAKLPVKIQARVLCLKQFLFLIKVDKVIDERIARVPSNIDNLDDHDQTQALEMARAPVPEACES